MNLPPLNLNSTASSQARGDATFGGNGDMNVNFSGIQSTSSAWPWALAAVVAVWYAWRSHRKG